MSTKQLLSSTTISSQLSFPSLGSIRESAIGLAKKGNGTRAIRLLRLAFFHSNLATKSEAAKKSMLRATWSAIEKELQERFEAGLKEDLNMLAEVYEREWDEELKLGVVYSAGEVLCGNVLAERDIALTIGRCDAMVLLLCEQGPDIREYRMLAIEEMLAFVSGE